MCFIDLKSYETKCLLSKHIFNAIIVILVLYVKSSRIMISLGFKFEMVNKFILCPFNKQKTENNSIHNKVNIIIPKEPVAC